MLYTYDLTEMAAFFFLREISLGKHNNNILCTIGIYRQKDQTDVQQ